MRYFNNLDFSINKSLIIFTLNVKVVFFLVLNWFHVFVSESKLVSSVRDFYRF